MAEVPVLDWRCTQCGEAMTWQLVKPQPGEEHALLRDVTREPPTLDWSCARCATATTWQLVRTSRTPLPRHRTDHHLGLPARGPRTVRG